MEDCGGLRGQINVWFWPNSAVRVSLAGCRTGKVSDCLDRQLSTRSGNFCGAQDRAVVNG
jgi:hypothetical protein